MSEIVLSGKGVTQRFGGLTAVQDVTFEVPKGEIVSIIGPNGAGKSTLFNCVTGIYTPTEGQIFFLGQEITGKKVHEISALGIGRTFQNIRPFSEMTALENVIVGSHAKAKSGIADALLHTPRYRREEEEAVKKAEEILKLTGLYEYRYHYATALSYGLQRRLEIARALASDPVLLLLDEPAAGMNEQETHSLTEFIRELKGMGYTILLIEHDMKLIMNISDYIYVLDRGIPIAEGTADEVRQNPLVIEAYLGKEA